MTVDATAMLRSLAREAIAAQRALDELAERSIARWDEDGMPGSGARYRRVAVAVPARFGAVPRTAAGAPSRLELTAGRRARGSMKIAFRRVEP
jgi:hypothetical protein